MNFEIRIFANPAGYEEIKLKAPFGYSLYTDDVVEKRNFDGERGTFPNGTFSVFYTPNAYVIAYHFFLPADTVFRDPKVHIAIAIKRGYKLLSPSSIIEKLSELFRNIVLEFKDTSRNQIYNRTEAFYNIVTPNINKDDLQFNINTSGSYTRRGILAYDKTEEKDGLLSDPFNMEFKDIDILYILQREETKKINDYQGYKLFSKFDFSAQKSFSLVYPDGHKIQISDIDQELQPYRVKRDHEKELIFEKGSIRENFSKWNIRISEDKTEYIIGLQPEKDERTIELFIVDKNNNVINVNDNEIKTNIGSYSNGILSLRGADIADFDIKHISIDTDKFQEKDRKWDNDSTIKIIVAKIQTIDLTELFKYIYDQIGHYTPVNVIVRRSNKYFLVKSDKPSIRVSCSCEDLYVKVPATSTTEETRLDFDRKGKITNLHLNKKKLKEIKFKFDRKFPFGLKKKYDNQGSVGTITYYYEVCEKGEKRIVEKKEAIKGNPVVISELPPLTISFEIQVDGYKTIEKTIDFNTDGIKKEDECILKPTSTSKVKRFCRRHVAAFVFGLFIGVVIGYVCLFLLRPNSSDSEYLIEEISVLKEENQRLIKELDSLKNIIAKPHVDEQSEIEETLQVDLGGKTHTTRLPETIGPTREQTTLINKLKGVNFTRDDVSQAKSRLSNLNQNDLIEDAEACLKILNLNSQEKNEVYRPKSKIYNMTVNKLNAHKDIMSAIIDNESYRTCTSMSFNTIAEMQKYIKDNGE